MSSPRYQCWKMVSSANCLWMVQPVMGWPVIVRELMWTQMPTWLRCTNSIRQMNFLEMHVGQLVCSFHWHSYIVFSWSVTPNKSNFWWIGSRTTLPGQSWLCSLRAVNVQNVTSELLYQHIRLLGVDSMLMHLHCQTSSNMNCSMGAWPVCLMHVMMASRIFFSHWHEPVSSGRCRK